MNEPCQRFAEDPEANAAHLRECERCRALYGELPTHSVKIEALPLAPWEGATYRSWPLVIGVALAVLALALALCAAAGITPLVAMMIAAQTQISRAGQVYEKLRTFGPLVYGILFLIVNSILILLLRRAPRGIDA
jgi:hypothetical protein